MRSVRRLVGGVALGALAAALSTAAYAQETTGGVRGQVRDETGAAVAGATVTVTHLPTQTRQTTVTSPEGYYSLRGLRAGGPYTVAVAASNFEPASTTVASIGLGDPATIDVTVQATGASVSEVTVTAASAAPKGAGTNFSQSDVASLPTISRDLKDIARLDPFVTVDASNDDALSFAGVNTRLNQLTVDGIRQNDEFGLNNNGYPTQRSPISLDAVESVSASAAPFSVINNGFIGGSINAVTKSGGSRFSGTAFYEYSDDNLLGDRYYAFDNRTRVDGLPNPNYGLRAKVPYVRVFEEKTWGATLGGPIIPDTLFFFLSYEKFQSTFSLDEGPTDGGFSTDIPRITVGAIETFRQATIDRYGYDPGSYVNVAPPVEDEKKLAKIDWNINADHRLSLTWQETRGTSFNGSTSSVFPNGDSVTQPRVGLESTQYLKDERLTSYSAQLNSQWTAAFSTELRVGYKETETTQLPTGGLTVGQVTVNVNDLPGVLPGSGAAQIQFGADNFRHDNYLYSENLNVELIGRYSLGAHDLTVGLRNEKRDFLNVFVERSLGGWNFASYADFLAGKGTLVVRGAVDPDGGTVPAEFGTARGGAVDFGYSVASLYVEDSWQALNDLRLTFGLRYDRFSMDDRPVLNTNFVDREGFANTANLDGKDLLMPRVSFNWRPGEWDVSGGVGLFSAIGTNVQIGNPFGNDGARITQSVCSPFTGVTDLTQVPTSANCTFTPGDGNVVALDPDFKVPSAWKFALTVGRNFELPAIGEFRLQADLIHNEFRDALYYTDLRALKIGTAPDGRPVYGRAPTATPTPNIFDLLLTNLSDGGHSTSVAVSARKSWNQGLLDGLDVVAAYTYTDAEDGNPMTSSQPDSSYVRFASADHNHPVLATSDYEIKNRFTVNAHWARKLFGDNESSINVFAQRRSGLPYSFVYHSSRSGNFDNDFGNVVPQSYSGAFGTSNQLFYVPKTDANGMVTAGSDPIINYSAAMATPQGMADFNAFLKNTGLIKYAGGIAPRNAFRSEAVTTIDLRLSQEIPVPYLPTGKVKVYMDIENFGNMLNPRWGVTEQYPFYRGVGTVVLTCGDGSPGACAAPGAVYTYSSLQTPNAVSGAVSNPDLGGFARRPQQILPTSTWQIKLGARFEF